MKEVSGAPGVPAVLLENPCFLLTRAGMVAQKEFGDRLEPLGLTPRMWGALAVLDTEGAITQHALCRSVGMDPSSMVSTIDELESKGYVERRRHPTDRRAHALHVTDPGRQALQHGRTVAAEFQDDLLGALSESERGLLQDMLRRVVLSKRPLAEPPGEARRTAAVAAVVGPVAGNGSAGNGHP